MIAKDIEVRGRVQGVWFRVKTKQQADKLGVKGWVCNLPNGSVGAHLEGEEEAVDKLAVWMGMGPPLARVEHLEETDAPVEGFTSFDIRH